MSKTVTTIIYVDETQATPSQVIPSINSVITSNLWASEQLHSDDAVFPEESPIFCQRIIVADSDGGLRDEPSMAKLISQQNEFITYYDQETSGKAATLNEILRIVDTDYVLFMDAGDTVSDDFFFSICKAAIETACDVIVSPVAYASFPNIKYPFSDRFALEDFSSVIDIDENPQAVQPNNKGALLATSIARSIGFVELFYMDDTLTLITKAILQNTKYAIVTGCKYYTSERENREDSIENVMDGVWTLEYYEEMLSSLHDMLLQASSCPYLKYASVHFLSLLLAKGSFNPKRFSEEETESIREKFYACLQLMEDSFLIMLTPIHYRISLLRVKYKNTSNVSYSLMETPTNIFSAYEGKAFYHVQQIPAHVNAMEIRNSRLHFMLLFPNTMHIPENELTAYVLREFTSGKSKSTLTADAHIYRYSNRDKYCFGFLLYEAYCIEGVMYVGSTAQSKFRLFHKIRDAKIPMKLVWNPASRLSYYAKMYSYQQDFLIEKTGTNGVFVYKYTKQKIDMLEAALMKEIRGHQKPDETKIVNHADLLRKRYIKSLPSLKKRRIWLFSDQPMRADDNAEHFFEYAISQDDGIEKYFAISMKSLHSERLVEKYGSRIIFTESDDYPFYLFACERLIVSQLIYFKGFFDEYKYFNGFFSTRMSFLQHGIIFNSLRNIYDNWRLNFETFISGCQSEYNHILDDSLSMSPDVLTLTGLARHDTLYSAPKKQILVCFTWRRYAVKARHATNERKYNPNFHKTSYYMGMQKLFNDPELVKKMRELGYVFMFRPHPEIMQQLSDFKETDTFKVVPNDVSYQSLFRDGSIMITDYSSTHVDFTYLNKPVLFYQYEPLHHDTVEGFFENDALGEVTDNHDVMVRLLIEYMENGGQLKPLYKERIDKYFTFRDGKNRERIYQHFIEEDPSRLLSVSLPLTLYKMAAKVSFDEEEHPFVLFAANHFGGKGNCQYQWTVYDEESNIVHTSDEQRNTAYVWYPSVVGTYTASVRAFDISGDETTEAYRNLLEIKYMSVEERHRIEIGKLTQQIRELKANATLQQENIASLQKKNEALEKKNKKILTSKSYQVTKPLRMLQKLLKGL